MKWIVNISVALIFFSPAGLFAEAVFLRDGSIIEGEMTSNTVRSVVIKSGDKTHTIQGDDILRIVYRHRWHDYREKAWVYMKEGGVLAGHVVGEESDYYIFRKELTVPEEKKIAKSEVKFIAHRPINEGPPPSKIINGDRTLFNNLLGIRLLTGLYVPKAPGHVDTPWDFLWAPVGFGFYYMDRFFEVQFDYFPELNGFGILNMSMTLLPFNGMDVGLGITTGFLQFKSYAWDAKGGTHPDLWNYSAGMMPVGLSYRLPNLFRIGLMYLVPMFQNLEVQPTGNSYDMNFPGLSFMLEAEFWVWKGLSLRLSWIQIRVKGRNTALTFDETYVNNTFLFGVSYGFQLP
jgi:hypothetical protein